MRKINQRGFSPWVIVVFDVARIFTSRGLGVRTVVGGALRGELATYEQRGTWRVARRARNLRGTWHVARRARHLRIQLKRGVVGILDCGLRAQTEAHDGRQFL